MIEEFETVTQAREEAKRTIESSRGFVMVYIDQDLSAGILGSLSKLGRLERFGIVTYIDEVLKPLLLEHEQTR